MFHEKVLGNVYDVRASVKVYEPCIQVMSTHSAVELSMSTVGLSLQVYRQGDASPEETVVGRGGKRR